MNLRTAFKAIYLKTSCNRIDEKKKNEFGPPFNRDVAGGGGPEGLWTLQKPQESTFSCKNYGIFDKKIQIFRFRARIPREKNPGDAPDSSKNFMNNQSNPKADQTIILTVTGTDKTYFKK